MNKVQPYKEPKLTWDEILEIRKKLNITPAKEITFKEKPKKPRGKRNLENIHKFHEKRYGAMGICLYKNCNTRATKGRFCARHQKQFLSAVANGSKRPLFKV